MQERRIFSRNPEFGVTKYWHYDDETDIARIETVQDVGEMLEVNSEAQANSSGKRWGEMAHVAHIPMAVYSEWMAAGRHRDEDFVRRWLNDPENRKHRTRLGKV